MNRFLNKIVLIDTAVYDLAEVELNGHTCIIGTNNRGKTTLLRAIAFFYNPSNVKAHLAIKSGEDDFASFYFRNNRPSYLIFEVKTERKPFHVFFYRTGSHINYRFVQSEYKRAFYFDSENVNMPLTLEDVLASMSSRQVWHSNEMKSWTEYREVLYGKFKAGAKSSQRALSQMYLFRGASQANNIPKIIRDIFLNSNPRFAEGLKSDFVKEFITSAVSDKSQSFMQAQEEEYLIDLSSLSVDLGKYLDHFEDIQTFHKTKVERGVIQDKFSEVKSLREDQNGLAVLIGSTFKFAKNQIGELQTEQKRKAVELAEKKTVFEEFERVQSQEIELLKEESWKLKSKIKNAESAKKIWDSEDFQKGYQKYMRENEFEQELDSKKRKLRMLETQFKTVAEKYNLQFQNLANRQKEYLNEWKAQTADLKNQLKADFFRVREI